MTRERHALWAGSPPQPWCARWSCGADREQLPWGRGPVSADVRCSGMKTLNQGPMESSTYGEGAIFRNHTVQRTEWDRARAWLAEDKRTLMTYVCFWKLRILMIQNTLLIKCDSMFYQSFECLPMWKLHLSCVDNWDSWRFNDTGLILLPEILAVRTGMYLRERKRKSAIKSPS